MDGIAYLRRQACNEIEDAGGYTEEEKQAFQDGFLAAIRWLDQNGYVMLGRMRMEGRRREYIAPDVTREELEKMLEEDALRREALKAVLGSGNW